jgi:drug/metabolite transporter (DMT)-like permease
MTQTTKAVLLCIAAVFMFNLETAFIKWVEGVPLATMVLARSLGQLAWILPELLRDPGLPRTRNLRMALFRGLLSAVSWYTYYLSYSGLPLATATVLSFTTVLFVTALAGPVLGERVGWRRWTAAMVGFAGVLAIVRPGVVEVGWPVAGAIFSALMGAAIVLTTKTLARSERTGTIMFWIGVVSVAISLPVALPGLEWMGWRNFALLAAAGVSGPLAMHLWINALRMADASFLAPISYTRLVFAAGFGIALFGEVPDVWLGVGTALILGSALYITRREAKLAKARRAQRGTAEAAIAASSGDGSKPKSR